LLEAAPERLVTSPAALRSKYLWANAPIIRLKAYHTRLGARDELFSPKNGVKHRPTGTIDILSCIHSERRYHTLDGASLQQSLFGRRTTGTLANYWHCHGGYSRNNSVFIIEMNGDDRSPISRVRRRAPWINVHRSFPVFDGSRGEIGAHGHMTSFESSRILDWLCAGESS
jgi:hypothetical protein